MSDISHIVVWNKNFKNHVKKVLEEAKVTGIKVVTDYHDHFKHHYFTNFAKGRRVNIITGPRWLRNLVEINKTKVIESNKTTTKFSDLNAAIDGIKKNFSCIQELADIEGLETSNPIHREDVGEHSRTVAKLVAGDTQFENYSKNNQNILLLSAYLHDIGKGPKSRWKDGVQQVDDDHPRKSLPMLKRILTEEIGGLSRRDIRRIHMLVIYDDLIGDIVANGRDRQQLFDVVKNKTDVDLLISLGKADMGAINNSWITYNEAAIEELRQSAYDAIEDK